MNIPQDPYGICLFISILSLFIICNVQAYRCFTTDEVLFLSLFIFWLRRILWGMGGGGLKKGGNAPQATESQRCKSSAS
jgi:hypothetical protein